MRDLSSDDKKELYLAAVENYKASSKSVSAKLEFRFRLIRLGFHLSEVEDELRLYE